MSGPKSDAATIQARRHRLLELLSEGKTKSECSLVLQREGFPASVNVLRMDINALMGQWGEANQDSVAEYRAGQLIELSELKAQLVSPAISAVKKVELALAIIDREIDLLGTKAPTKSISASISAEMDPDALVGYRRFVYETRGLGAEDIEQVFRYARSLARPATVEHAPPAEAELWEEEKQ